MAAWVFSGVLVGFMACLLLSLTVAAHCVNPARRHNSFRMLRLRWNWLGRLFCGAWQVSVPDPVEDPWFQDPRRRAELRERHGVPGIALALLAQLPTHLVPAHGAEEGQLAEGSAAKGEGGEEECAICQDEFGGGQRVAVLPCQHAFHEACIHKWLLQRATCPMCQREITEDAVHGRPEKQQPLPEQPGSVAVDIPAPAATQQGSGGAGPAAPPGSQPPAVGGQGGAACTCGAAQQPPGSAAPAAGLPV